MGEIRLKCPECGAEYRLPADAIPVRGRDVECSACGHVWLGTRPVRPAIAGDPADRSGNSPAPGDPAPQLNRPLPRDVLAILREEAARELDARTSDEARAAGDIRRHQPGLAGEARRGGGAKVSAVDDWPATTVVVTASPDRSDTAAAAASIPPMPLPAPAQTEPPPTSEGAAASLPADNSGPQHRLGFRLGLGLMALFLALYLVAPRLGDNGPLGAALTEMRQSVDAGRLWLSGLLGNADSGSAP